MTWIAGGPPRPAVPEADGDIEVPANGVRRGRCRSACRRRTPPRSACGPAPASRSRTTRGTVKNVRVSGIFRAADSADPAWRLAPWLLRPGLRGGRRGHHPARRPAVGGVPARRPARLRAGRASRAPSGSAPTRRCSPGTRPGASPPTVVALKASSGSSGSRDTSLKWETQLDAVLRDVRAQVGAAFGAGVGPAHRRAGHRGPGPAARRGPAGPPPGPGADRRPAAGRGPARPRRRAAARVDGGGAGGRRGRASPWPARSRRASPGGGRCRWSWPGPSAGPVFGTLTAARATRARRVPANRTRPPPGPPHRATPARRRRGGGPGRRGRRPRRAAPARHPHRRAPGTARAGTAVPRCRRARPTLGVLAGTLILLRLLPAGNRLVLRRALRSRRPLAVFGAARAAATSARVLPLLVLVTSTALAAFALTLHDDRRRGPRRRGVAHRRRRRPPRHLRRAALHARGRRAHRRRAGGPAGGRRGDHRRLAHRRRLGGHPAAAGRRGRRRLPSGCWPPPRCRTSRPSAGSRRGGNGDLPALVRSRDGSLRPGMRLQLLRENAPAIRLTAVGTAPVGRRRGRRRPRRRRRRRRGRPARRAEHGVGDRPGSGNAPSPRTPSARAPCSAPTSCATVATRR